MYTLSSSAFWQNKSLLGERLLYKTDKCVVLHLRDGLNISHSVSVDIISATSVPEKDHRPSHVLENIGPVHSGEERDTSKHKVR